MLKKTSRVTHISAVAGQAYRAASLVCSPVPPPPDNGPVAPPPPPPPAGGGGGGGVTYYVYVPVNPINPYWGETRTAFENHPGAGYTCDVVPMQYFIDDPNFPGGLTPVYERRCHWTYP